MAISDRGYQKGIERLEAELAEADAPKVRTDHVCLITIRGEKRAH
jgi:hypothetical protein